MTTALSKLSDLERDRLAACEERIERGIDTFIDVGEALLTIRTEGLYRETHRGDFEGYCRDRWGFTDEHARRLMRTAEVMQTISETPPIGGVLPKVESQARPLTKLPKAQQADAWQEAVETAPEGKVTAKHVQEVVDRRTGEVMDDAEIVTTKRERVGNGQRTRGTYNDTDVMLETLGQINDSLGELSSLHPKANMRMAVLEAARDASKKLTRLIAAIEKEL